MSRKIVAGVLLTLGITGCAQEYRARYAAPPDAPASEVAVCKGVWGTCIQEVDGWPVGQGDPNAFNVIGNTVRLAPGYHEFRVITDRGAVATSGFTGPLVGFIQGGEYAPTRFVFNCDKGHVYEFSRRTLNDSELKVTDKNTGKSLDIDENQ